MCLKLAQPENHQYVMRHNITVTLQKACLKGNLQNLYSLSWLVVSICLCFLAELKILRHSKAEARCKGHCQNWCKQYKRWCCQSRVLLWRGSWGWFWFFLCFTVQTRTVQWLSPDLKTAMLRCTIYAPRTEKEAKVTLLRRLHSH